MRDMAIGAPARKAALILLSIMLTGCVGPSPTRLAIPYQYPSLAAGSEGVATVVLAPQSERAALSRAIVRALQEMEYSVIRPALPVGDLLPEGHDIVTDAVPLVKADIASHNRDSFLAPIPDDALYRLAYRLRYRVEDESALAHKQLSLIIWSVLERRGAGGRWHAYPKTYSARFFAGRLCSRIEAELRRNHGAGS